MSEPTGFVRIKGAKELRRSMKQAGMDMKQLSKLGREAAEVVVGTAKANAPRGPGIGGHIADTIRVGATQKAGIVRVGNARLPYAGVVHYGTPDGAVHPNPWVINAAQATEPQWTELYWSGLMKIVDKIQGAPHE